MSAGVHNSAILVRSDGDDLESHCIDVRDYFTNKQQSGGGELAETKSRPGFAFTGSASGIILALKHTEGNVSSNSFSDVYVFKKKTLNVPVGPADFLSLFRSENTG